MQKKSVSFCFGTAVFKFWCHLIPPARELPGGYEVGENVCRRRSGDHRRHSLTAIESQTDPQRDVRYGEAGVVQGVPPSDGYDLAVLFSGTKDRGVILQEISREEPDGALL